MLAFSRITTKYETGYVPTVLHLEDIVDSSDNATGRNSKHVNQYGWWSGAWDLLDAQMFNNHIALISDSREHSFTEATLPVGLKGKEY